MFYKDKYYTNEELQKLSKVKMKAVKYLENGCFTGLEKEPDPDLILECINYIDYCVNDVDNNMDNVIDMLDINVKQKERRKTYKAYFLNTCYYSDSVPYDFVPCDPNQLVGYYGYSIMAFEDVDDYLCLKNELLSKTNWCWKDLERGYDASSLQSTMECFIDKTFLEEETVKVLKKKFMEKIFEKIESILKDKFKMEIPAVKHFTTADVRKDWEFLIKALPEDIKTYINTPNLGNWRMD